MSNALSPFENHEVVGTTISITNAGDGLSEAMKIDPVEWEHGEKVFVLLETEVAKVRFDPSKDNSENLVRVHVLKAGTATVMDAGKAKPMIAAQKKKIEEAEGIEQLPGLDEAAGGDD